MTNPHSVDISLTAYNQTFQAPWVGTVELDEAGKWFDDFMLLVSRVPQVTIKTVLTVTGWLEQSISTRCECFVCLIFVFVSVSVCARLWEVWPTRLSTRESCPPHRTPRLR